MNWTWGTWRGTSWGWLSRREVEVGLVPGLTAVLALLQEADSHVLGEDLPDWLERVTSVMPAELGVFHGDGSATGPCRM